MRFLSWNVNRCLDHKLCDSDFTDNFLNYDVIFLSECWIKSDTFLDLSLLCDFECLRFPRAKGSGGGLLLLYKKSISPYISFVKCVSDSLVWIKISDLSPVDIFVFFAYIPHENNVFYNLYKFKRYKPYSAIITKDRRWIRPIKIYLSDIYCPSGEKHKFDILIYKVRNKTKEFSSDYISKEIIPNTRRAEEFKKYVLIDRKCIICKVRESLITPKHDKTIEKSES